MKVPAWKEQTAGLMQVPALPRPDMLSALLDALASLALAAFGRGDCVPKRLFWMGDRARFAA